MEPLAMAAVCDDVRLEHNGKLIIVGLYPQLMTFPELPATLNQIWVVVTVFSDLNDPILKFTVAVTAPGTNFSYEYDAGLLQPAQFPDVTRAEISAFVLIPHFVVTEPGTLDIKIKYPGGELRARRLLLQLSPSPSETPEVP